MAKVPLAQVEVKVQREECARFLVAALRVMVVTVAMAATEEVEAVERAVHPLAYSQTSQHRTVQLIPSIPVRVLRDSVEQEVNRWGLMVQMGNQGLLQTFCSRDYKISGSRCYRRLV